MTRKNIKQVPQFKNEDEEAEFWLEHDFSDYYEPTKQVNLELPNLKPSTQSVTIRLPKPLLRNLKVLANEQDVPYQSLLKTLLDEKVKEKLSFKHKLGQQQI